ncbi:protein NnrS [Aliidongia dinghuensis]|uniref:Protein NnrS n=1 Tax=Aliidongia dinghuensis TaxID=1867774 RepID=A0A8J2Z188_9PROT|nr:NnrS family protein [Aliidongia dinghuensis]GGF43457.1 protein NnrS [Aliidongia dinghuensis]
MSATAGHAAADRRPVVWAQGFRPFFLATAFWAVFALAVWIGMLETGTALPSRFDPLSWHIHEMLFGFVMAGVGGFLLTAIANWTHRPPVHGLALALLALAWLIGRIACMVSSLLPSWQAVALDLAFPAALLATAAHEIVAGRNWRNLPMLLSVAVLGVANLLMHLEATGAAVPAGIGWRLGIAAMVVLVSVIAGRIVPTFTRNWLTKRGATVLPPERGLIDRSALGTLHAGLIGWALWPAFAPIGALLLGAAALNAWRLARWRGLATRAEPLLLILHVGYGWMVAGTALLGCSILADTVPETAALHTLTTGAFGTMILAVMTRATLGHTGRALTASRWTVGIYAAVTLAALSRIAAALGWGPDRVVLDLSATLWGIAFCLFLACYGPMLVSAKRGA